MVWERRRATHTDGARREREPIKPTLTAYLLTHGVCEFDDDYEERREHSPRPRLLRYTPENARVGLFVYAQTLYANMASQHQRCVCDVFACMSACLREPPLFRCTVTAVVVVGSDATPSRACAHAHNKVYMCVCVCLYNMSHPAKERASERDANAQTRLGGTHTRCGRESRAQFEFTFRLCQTGSTRVRPVLAPNSRPRRRVTIGVYCTH